MEARRGSWIFRSWCYRKCGFRELNLGPLQDQQALLTAELSLQCPLRKLCAETPTPFYLSLARSVLLVFPSSWVCMPGSFWSRRPLVFHFHQFQSRSVAGIESWHYMEPRPVRKVELGIKDVWVLSACYGGRLKMQQGSRNPPRTLPGTPLLWDVPSS